MDRRAAEQIHDVARHISLQASPPSSLQRELDALPKLPAENVRPAPAERGLRLTPPTRGHARSPGVSTVSPKPSPPQGSQQGITQLTSPSLEEDAGDGGALQCGQCQVSFAEVRCRQCDEIFCGKCSAQMHRAGRMREHELVPIPQDKAPAALAGPQHQQHSSVPTCPTHVGEPLHFFCLSCVECICAECAIQRTAAHHGHDVVNTRVAFQQLSDSMKQALETAAAHLEGSPATQRAQMQPVEDVFSNIKLDVVNGFESLFSSLKTKEEELLLGVEECGRLVDGLLLAKAQHYEARLAGLDRLQEMLPGLAGPKESELGDEVQRLNRYVALKDHLAALPSHSHGHLTGL